MKYDDINDYVRQAQLPCDVQFCPNGEFIQQAIAIARSRPYLWTIRKAAIARLLAQAEQQIGKVRLRFRLFFRQKAYASDSGEITLSLAYVNKADGAMLLRTILHEIGHIYASRLAEYPQILALAKTYNATFGKNLIAMEPTEYVATSFSIAALLEVAKSADEKIAEAIKKQADGELKKLSDALNELKTTAI